MFKKKSDIRQQIRDGIKQGVEDYNQMKDKGELKALQESADKNKELYKYERPNPGLLETFPAPEKGMSVQLNCLEHTSLCPKTGQADYAKVHISYEPIDKCVETKSLKLYLMGFRNYGAFCEQSAKIIKADLVAAIDPEFLSVEVVFESRGGIEISAISTYYKTLLGTPTTM